MSTAQHDEELIERLDDDDFGGPSLRAQLHRNLNLIWTLAVTDWRLRFYGSVLGVLWTLVRPFAFFGVLYFVFTEVANLDASVEFYGVYILYAMVLFNFFGETVSTSIQSLVVREGLLRKMRFDPIVIPLSVMVTALLNLLTTLAAVTIFAVASGVYPRWTWIELPFLIALLAFFATGLGMLLSALYVRYRDVMPIWEVAGQALFYASAVLYVVDPTVPAQWRAKFLVNPIAAVMTQMRHAVIDPSAPTTAQVMQQSWRVIVPLGIVAVTFAVGYRVFSRASPRIAEMI